MPLLYTITVQIEAPGHSVPRVHLTNDGRKVKPSREALGFILLHLHRGKTELFLLHTFEGVHDVLVVSHLQGVDLVSGISGSGDFLSLGCQHPQVDGGRGCHGNRPLQWDTVQAPAQALKSFH